MTMQRRWLALLTAVLLVSLAPLEVMAARGGGGGRGFGGGRSGGFGGFGGSRSSRPSTGGGFGGFFGFGRSRSTPSPSESPGFGGFSRSRPNTSSSEAPATGGFGSRTAPPAAATAPSATPSLAPVPATTGTGRPGGTAPAASSIDSALPSARPSAAGSTATTAAGRTSISESAPTALPRAGTRGGIERPRALPAPTSTPPPIERRWGGVHVPPGYSYWGYAPYHYMWWLGWPSPYGGLYRPYHAGFFVSLLVGLLLFGVLAAVVAAGIMLYRRRPVAAPIQGREWPPKGWDA
jgi:hypothetical protein